MMHRQPEIETQATAHERRENLHPVKLVTAVAAVVIAAWIANAMKSWISSGDAGLFFNALDGLVWPLAGFLFVLVATVIGIVHYRVSLRTVIVSVGIIYCCFFTATQFIRVDGFYGNLTPKFAWRWTPTAEDCARQLLVSTPSNQADRLDRGLFESTDQDWPCYRGSHADGRVTGPVELLDWQEQQPVELWRHPVGFGWSSFAVVGSAAVTMEQRGEFECTVCYNARTGQELWCHREQTRYLCEHGDGPRATPSVATGNVLSLGGSGVLTCCRLESGELLWKREMFNKPETQNLRFGTSASPLVIGDRVIVTTGGDYDSAAWCLSIHDGSVLWQTADDHASYASPIAAEVCGESQILSFNGDGLRSYSIEGKSLWFFPWVTQGESRVNVAQPLVLPSSGDGDSATRILISSGYDCGTALLEVTHTNDEWKVLSKWISRDLKSKFSNFVVHEEAVFGFDNGIFGCISLRDGKRFWKRGRYGHGQVLIVGDRLLIQAESGELVVLSAAADALKELHRFPALDGKTWNNPAVAGDLLLVRNDREAAAFQLPKSVGGTLLTATSSR
ncbi:MAG: PQQ-binding-like beta-propeller repeat protein [Pirellulales bacterium]